MPDKLGTNEVWTFNFPLYIRLLQLCSSSSIKSIQLNQLSHSIPYTYMTLLRVNSRQLQPHLTWSTDIVKVPVLIHVDRSSVAKGQATPVNELENLPKEDVKRTKHCSASEVPTPRAENTNATKRFIVSEADTCRETNLDLDR